MNELLMTKVKELQSESQKLVDEIRGAKVMTAFDETGNGPFLALADHHFSGKDGPILRQAARVGQLLLDVERLMDLG